MKKILLFASLLIFLPQVVLPASGENLCTISVDPWSLKPSSDTTGLIPGKLTCEYSVNPLGIDIAAPGLSWTLLSGLRNQKQSAYEIIVCDNESYAANLHGNVWNSGKIISSQTLHIPCSGAPLKSFTRYWWRVRVYDKDGKVTPWSKTAWFETAMLSDKDWEAEWISDGRKQFIHDKDFYGDDPMPLFRKLFSVKRKIVSARLYISGLGYYEAYINGRKAGDHSLDPGWTSYAKQVPYSVFDITDLLKQGSNACGIMTGNGWYNPLPLRMWGHLNLRDFLTTGRPCVKAMIRIAFSDGSENVIATDESWLTASGPVVRNSVYLGEHYDARLERANWTMPVGISGFRKSTVVAGPSGKLVAGIHPPVRVTRIIKPVRISEPKQGVFVVDMGQNFAGVARIRVKGPSGARIILRYGEDIYPDGNLNVMTSVAGQIKNNNGGPGAPAVAWQEDSYILKGQGTEEWSPLFTFHGFRYVEVTGWPGKPAIDDIEGLRMNSDLDETGSFVCSDPVFNRLLENTKWTFLSNVFSVQSDCPAREKFGYGGDIVATAEAFLYSFDMSNFYRKVVRDFADARRPLGGITETAPYVGIADRGPGDGSGPLGWQLAFPFLIKQIYDFYGDKKIVEENYDALVKQGEFLRNKAKGNLYYSGISDHESLDAKPEALTSSAFYYHHIKLLSEFAGISGRLDDATKYGQLADTIKSAILKKFYYMGSGRLDNGTQAAQIFGLWYGFPPEDEKDAALNILTEEIGRNENHLSTGIFATKMLFDVLRRAGRNDIAVKVACNSSFPGWGYMIEKGATTIWETWAYSDNVYSQNHPMFGSVTEWFYRSLLGINAGSPGFEKIILKPQPAGNLTFAKGSYMSVHGKISSDWKITGGKFFFRTEIPTGTTAEIWIPVKEFTDLKESGLKVQQVDGIHFLRSEDGYCVLETGSGVYSFEGPYNRGSGR
jgi:alpha-L-rhamnosidase